MKIIFLDIDGVLVNRRSLMIAGGMQAPGDPDCVANLNRITAATGARLVLSSTWRIEGLMFMREKLREWGVTEPLMDVTPLLRTRKGDIAISESRGFEIAQWMLDYQRHEIEAFVILDDDSDMEHLSAHLVRTEFERGLTMAEAERAIALLNAEVRP